MSSLQISLDMTSMTPHYEQLRTQLAGLIHTGELKSGDRLPTVRAFANDLGINPGTVSRAYRDLEAEGLAVTRRRTGTVVAGHNAEPDAEPLLDEFVALVAKARSRGLTDRQIRDIVGTATLRVTDREVDLNI